MEENYKLEKINYDDLYVISSYCNLSPEHFNYNKDDLLSKEAKEFMDEIYISDYVLNREIKKSTPERKLIDKQINKQKIRGSTIIG